jgi:osmoprotectant transport system substrate-binding protein
MKNRTKLIRAVPALLMGLSLLLIVSCGNIGGTDSSGSGGSSGPTIVVGSKDFTEQFILGSMYAQALDANGFNGVAKLNLGSEQIADKALQNGQIDLYPEYTGTSLVAIVPYRGNPADLNTEKATYEAAKKLYAKRKPADTMLTPANFNNTYGIFVRKSVAERDNLTNMEELAKDSKNLTFISFSQFQNRSDGYPNVKKNYPAFDFKEIKIVNELGLRYSGLQSGDGDVGVGFTTDGQLTSPQLVVMKDPKSIWPFYHPAPVIRSDVLKKYPKIKGILNKVTASLDVKTMRELNGEVDLHQEDPEDVAKQYLEQQGIIKN